MIEYVAGVVDAIGHIRIREVNGTKLPQLTVSSPNKGLCDRLAAATGVGVTQVRRSYDRLGCSTHCEEPHMHVRSTTYRWQLVGARARLVLEAVEPLLSVRSEIVRQVLEESAGATEKSAVVQKMKALGWAA